MEPQRDPNGADTSEKPAPPVVKIAKWIFCPKRPNGFFCPKRPFGLFGQKDQMDFLSKKTKWTRVGLTTWRTNLSSQLVLLRERDLNGPSVSPPYIFVILI